MGNTRVYASKMTKAPEGGFFIARSRAQRGDAAIPQFSALMPAEIAAVARLRRAPSQ